MPTRALITSYKQDLHLFPDMWHKVGLAFGAVFFLVYPVLLNDHWVTIANQACIAVVGAASLMILTGFCGQISLGHAAFLALGAYTTAVCGNHYELPFWIGVPAGGIVAALVGLSVGPFALRLRGLYLAIVSVGLVFLVNHVLLHLPAYTGGSTGVQVPNYLWFNGEASALNQFSSRKPLDTGLFYLNYEQLLF